MGSGMVEYGEHSKRIKNLVQEIGVETKNQIINSKNTRLFSNNVISLDLSNLNLRTFPTSLQHFRFLRKLYAKYNSISKFPFEDEL